MKFLRYLLPPFFLLFLFLLLWEVYVRLGFIYDTILPTPSAILSALVAYQDILFIHTAQTVWEALIGLGVAIVLGLSTAILISLSPFIRKAIYPFLVFSQSIPIIALAPLLLLWFGFDLLPKVIIVTLYCFFPITIAVADSLLNTDEYLIDLLKGMRASTWQILLLVRLPNSLPAFFSGLRIAVTYSLVGAIVGEYVGAYRGLGIFMQTAANTHAVVLVFAALVMTTLVSIVFFVLVSFIEKIVIPWKIKYA